MKLQKFLGAAIGVSLLSISPLWAQSLEKIGEGAKKEGEAQGGAYGEVGGGGQARGEKICRSFSNSLPVSQGRV